MLPVHTGRLLDTQAPCLEGFPNKVATSLEHPGTLSLHLESSNPLDQTFYPRILAAWMRAEITLVCITCGLKALWSESNDDQVACLGVGLLKLLMFNASLLTAERTEIH